MPPTPTLVTAREFSESRFAQLAESNDGVDIAAVLVRAEAAIQSKIRRKIKAADYVETFKAESQTMFVRQRPIISVSGIRRRAYTTAPWQTMSLSRIMVDTAAGYIESMDYVRGYQIEVSYRAGYEVIPEDIKEAVIMQTALFAYQDLEIYGSGDGKTPGIMYFKTDINELLMPYMSDATVWH